MPSFSAKQFVLPFWAQKNKESQEAAAIFAVAELNRSRGGGFISKQPAEKLVCIAKIAYPLWMFPKNGTTLIFDGLNDKNYRLTYTEIPSPETFMTSLEQKQHPRESYTAFLAEYTNYFSQPQKEQYFTLRGLIAEAIFREELGNYRKEANEITQSDVLLVPTLEEATIAKTIQELCKLEETLRSEEEKLDKCRQFLKKTTNKYITEIDYQIVATTEEADAKIKAQEEQDKPQITKLNKEYSRKIKQQTENFEGELDSFVKRRLKIQTAIEKSQDNIEQYKQESKAYAKKGHKIYEKRWKQKIKIAEKELSALKKEIKTIDESTKKTSRQKEQDLARLNLEWDTKIKLVYQPIVVLEKAKNAKTEAFKQESNQLREIEKPVVEGIEKTLRYKATIEAAFEGLGFSDPALRVPSVVYVPFYVVGYATDLAIRYLFIAPSMIQKVNFSSKFKGVLGMSKTKDLLVPRFNSVANFIKQIQEYTQKNNAFGKQLADLAEKTNLLKNSTFQTNIKSGLSILQEDGSLSQRETEILMRQLEV